MHIKHDVDVTGDKSTCYDEILCVYIYISLYVYTCMHKVCIFSN